jgi:acyl carrier protein
LKDMSTTSKAHRLLKPVIYKLFDNLMTYGKDYQWMEEVWVDAECHDAVGTVNLPNTTESGNFLYNPFWIDAAIHFAGFLLNGSLKYPEDIACLSVGFESWRISEELQPASTYTTYFSMQDTETPNTLSGSAYVYNNYHKLVQVTTGIKFLKLKKMVLSSVLRPGASSSIEAKRATVNFKGPSSVPKISKPSDTGSTTPETQLSDDSSDEKENPRGGTVSLASSVSESGGANFLDAFLAIIASESAYNVEDMEQGTAFADMGMDSITGITILAAVQRDTGVELPATFLLDKPTVGDVTAALLGDKHSEPVSEHVALA